MGPEEPEPMTTLGPKQMREKINKLRDYLVAIHVQNIEFNAAKNSFTNTPSGVLISIKPRKKKQVCGVPFMFGAPPLSFYGYFWGDYDRSPRISPLIIYGSPTYSNFGHLCVRGITFDFNTGTRGVSNVKSYQGRIYQPGHVIEDFLDDAVEIPFWFVPDGDAVANLLESLPTLFVLGDDPVLNPDSVPMPSPTGTKISIKMWLEMHLDWYANDAEGGGGSRIRNHPRHLYFGPETDSIPKIWKLCYSQ